MPEPVSFDYAVVRVVPRVEREEFVNAGVVLFCPERKFLAVRARVDEQRLRALWPSIEMEEIRRHVQALEKVAEGGEDAGPIGQLLQRERFHWIVAPRSTVIQISPVHTGICEDPAEQLRTLFASLVPADRAAH